MNHSTEEDYLKAIYALSKGKPVSTNDLAAELQVKASSITDMIKKLSDKKYVDYIKYQGVELTPSGRQIALKIMRKHRLWETFLVKNLHFGWDEVHEIAEQLEHIESEMLTDRLDDFLGNPQFDPHGDPIPNKEGIINDTRKRIALQDVQISQKGIIVGVSDASSDFLKFLESENLVLGTQLEVIEKYSFDNSLKIRFYDKELNISEKGTFNIIIELLN
jgi:DtxR family transcriptional regulator, Mn-dependent transcriptional regulator